MGADATRHESRMAVTARDGRRFERHAHYRKGSPQNPMSQAERHTKFQRLTGAVFKTAAVEQIIAEVEALDRASGIGKLVPLLQPSAQL